MGFKPNSWTSSMCDSQVSGCQLPAWLVRKAHMTRCQSRPWLTHSFSVTYSGSSKWMKPHFVTGQNAANVTAPRSKQMEIVRRVFVVRSIEDCQFCGTAREVQSEKRRATRAARTQILPSLELGYLT